MQQAALNVEQSNVVYAINCSYKYSGGTSGLNGFNVEGRCFTYSKNCIAASNLADGFNYHNWSGSPPPVSVEIDCVGRNNGFNTGGTNNGSTTHDGGTIIRVNGKYFENQNRNIHDVNDAYSWNLGSVVFGSRGPDNQVNFAAGTGTDTTQMWLDQCTSDGSLFDYEARPDSRIFTHDSIDNGQIVSGSVVSEYTP